MGFKEMIEQQGDPWMVLNNEDQGVDKYQQMKHKLKLYEEYGKKNAEMMNIKIEKETEPMRASWTKNDKISPYLSLAMKRNKEHGTSDSYGGAHGGFYTEMDGPNRNRGGF